MTPTGWSPTSEEHDKRRLQDILRYGEAALQVASSGDDLEVEVVSRLASERVLFVVGNAASSLSDGARTEIDQPWRQIFGLRIMLAHQEEVAEVERMVTVALVDLPTLLTAIRAHLAKNP